MGGGREAKVDKEQNKRHGCVCGIAHDHLAVLLVVRKKQNGRPGQESARYSTKTTAYGKGGGYADQTPEEDSIDSNARVLPEDLIDGGQRQKGEAGWVARRVCGAVDGDGVSPLMHDAPRGGRILNRIGCDREIRGREGWFEQGDKRNDE